jgi:hypothetical protein
VPRLLCGLVGALALACGTDARAQSAPFSVEDLLNQESIGNVRISPNSRWVVIDREAAWGGAGSYDLGQYTAQLLTSLEIHDASGTAPLKRGSPTRVTVRALCLVPSLQTVRRWSFTD